MNGQALRIFAHAPRRRALVRPGRPRPVVPIESTIESTVSIEPATTEEIGPPLETLDATVEQTLLEILASPPQFGETIEAAYRRKERALADVLGSLSRGDAALLQSRLSEPRTDDVLAQRFSRLVVDRRTRLLAILSDAPRREARRR